MRLVLIECSARRFTVLETHPKRQVMAVFEIEPGAEVTPADVEAIRIEPHQPSSEK